MTWESLLPPAIMLVSIVVALWVMIAQWRRARLIEDTPTSRIRSAAQGYVELSGFAHGDDDAPLLAPLTRTPCVWYRYRIERYERGSKRSQWNTVESGESDRWFVLDDGSGRCHIDPRGAQVSSKSRQRWRDDKRISTDAPHTAPLDLLQRAFGADFNIGNTFGGVLTGRLFDRGEYRYTEWRIHPGEFVYTLGDFSTVHAPATGERTQAAMKNLLNAWKQDRTALLARFDDNRDGDIDLREWENARRAAGHEARAQELAEPAAPALNVLGKPAHRDQPYLIATDDPERLVRRHRWQALASLLVGTLIAAIAGWHTFHR